MYKSSHLKSKPADRYPSGANIWQILIKQSGLDRIASLLVGALIDNSELKVNWKSDRHGNSYLEIFDPQTKIHHYFQSEQAALIWIEKR